MNHSPQLIEEIAAKVRADYPTEQSYLYIFEKQLGQISGLPGMSPDIYVELLGRGVCAVEIGNIAKPLKLIAYRDRYLIPDVRWYDHDGLLVMSTRHGFGLASMLLHATPSGSKTVFRALEGSVRVYVRRHINGCPLQDDNQQNCGCPKWFYISPRGAAPYRKSAGTPNFAEACDEARKIVKDFYPGDAPDSRIFWRDMALRLNAGIKQIRERVQELEEQKGELVKRNEALRARLERIESELGELQAEKDDEAMRRVHELVACIEDQRRHLPSTGQTNSRT